MPLLMVRKLDPLAQLPVYGSNGAIGMDLRALVLDIEEETPSQTFIAPGERRLIRTGIAAIMPEGFYGRVAPRSGLAFKHGIDVLAGVIDPDYRGEIAVVLVNHGHDSFMIKHGDRIAQLIMERAEQVSIQEVSDTVFVQMMTERASQGFGSTGV